MQRTHNSSFLPLTQCSDFLVRHLNMPPTLQPSDFFLPAVRVCVHTPVPLPSLLLLNPQFMQEIFINVPPIPNLGLYTKPTKKIEGDW